MLRPDVRGPTTDLSTRSSEPDAGTTSPPSAGERRTAPACTTRVLASLSAVALLAVSVVPPATAHPAERADEHDVVLAELEDGLVVFVRASRDELCAWFDEGSEGRPPIAAPSVITGPGTSSSSREAEHLRLWTIGAVLDLRDACQNADAASNAGAGRTAPPSTGSDRGSRGWLTMLAACREAPSSAPFPCPQ